MLVVELVILMDFRFRKYLKLEESDLKSIEFSLLISRNIFMSTHGPTPVSDVTRFVDKTVCQQIKFCASQELSADCRIDFVLVSVESQIASSSS